MRQVFTIGAIASAVVGLGASIASAIDDLSPAPAFCAEAGCETVRASVWARPLGIPMSLLGIVFFAAMIALAFVERPRLRRVLAIVGGAWAVWLVVLQAFVIDAWCKLCLVADPAGIVLAICVAAGARTVAVNWRRIAVVVPAVAAVVLVLAAWTHVPAPDLPASDPNLPEFMKRAQAPEGVTIVEFVDFECPFCREMQKRLDAAIARTKVPVKIVRKMMPLPDHRGSIPAAIAWCCADAQGKGDAMARALFEATPEELTVGGCLRIAEEVGCDLDRYRADVKAVAMDRIRRDIEDAQIANIEALPTMFVGDVRVTGAALTTEELVRVIEDQANRE